MSAKTFPVAFLSTVCLLAAAPRLARACVIPCECSPCGCGNCSTHGAGIAESAPLYRLEDPEGRSLLTAGQDEHDRLVKAGWTSHSAVGQVYRGSDDAPDLVPLYRLSHPKNGGHFYAASEAERAAAVSAGYEDGGVVGYVFTEPAQGRLPLYRAYNPQTARHLFIADEAEYNKLSEDWQREGVAAYVLE